MATGEGGGEWTCQACTMANPGIVNECLTCGTPGGETVGGGGGGGGEGGDAWTCGACTMSNDSAALACHMCGTPRPAGGGGGGAATASPSDKPDWYSLIWGPGGPPSSWTSQGLAFEGASCSDGDGRPLSTRLAIKQGSNGPCGALAAVQAAALSLTGREGSGEEGDDLDADAALADAVAAIIAQAAPSGGEEAKYRVATWSDPGSAPSPSSADGVAVSEYATRADLRKALCSDLPQYKSAGGACLLVYSAVLTRGVDAVKADMARSGGEPPLVLPPFALCSSDLLMLLLRGAADGNVGAYEHASPGDGGAAEAAGGAAGAGASAAAVGGKVTWTSELGVGMLSLEEADTGVPLADRLVSPEKPVWILHGGDHFTVAWTPPSSAPSAGDGGGAFDVLHWNGLPPAGPRLARLAVTAPSGARPPAPDRHRPAYYKPIPGQIQDVVQAHPDDKSARPGQYETWRYEVQLAVDDPDVSGEERPPDAPKPELFEQGPPPSPGAGWRCATCYSKRFQTMCFGVNEAGAEECRHCGRRLEECGWTIWLTYDELPEGQKKQCARVHAPKIVSLIRTKWPGAKVEYGDQSNPPAV